MGREEYSITGPKCPYCLRQHVADEGHYFDESGFTEMDCDECGKNFGVSVCISTSWTTNERKQELEPTKGQP